MTEKEEFIEFFNRHPDLDNTEYYAEFPEANKSTIRSWKATLLRERAPPETDKPEETPPIKSEGDHPELRCYDLEGQAICWRPQHQGEHIHNIGGEDKLWRAAEIG